MKTLLAKTAAEKKVSMVQWNKYGTIGDSDNSDHYHLHFISNDFYNQRTVNLGPARSKKLYAISKASLQEMNV